MCIQQRPLVNVCMICQTVLMSFAAASLAAGEPQSPDAKSRADSHADNVEKSDALEEAAKLANRGIQLPAEPEMEFDIRWPLSSLAFAPNGRYLAGADRDRGVYLWDLKSRKKVWEFKLPALGAVSSEAVEIRFTGDGKHLLLGSYCRDPLVLDASSGKTLQTFGHWAEWCAPAVATWRKDKKELAVTSSNGDLHVWGPSNAKEVMTLEGAGRKVISLEVARHAAQIVLGLQALGRDDRSDTGRLLVRELPSGRILLDVRQSESPIRRIAISPRGEHVIGASRENVACWSVARKERLWLREEDFGDSMSATDPGNLAMSPNGKSVAYGLGSRLVLCDVRSGKTVSERRYERRISGTPYGRHEISAVAFSDDGISLAVGTDAGLISVWRLAAGDGERNTNDEDGEQ